MTSKDYGDLEIIDSTCFTVCFPLCWAYGLSNSLLVDVLLEFKITHMLTEALLKKMFPTFVVLALSATLLSACSDFRFALPPIFGLYDDLKDAFNNRHKVCTSGDALAATSMVCFQRVQ